MTDRKASKPYQGPPDPSFIALDASKPESDREVNDGSGRRDWEASAERVQFLYSR
jgi:hypothetical protein